MIAQAILAGALFIPLTTAQLARAAVQTTDFNSSFSFSPAQIQDAQLDSALVETLQNIINYDRSQLAFGGPSEDDFYRVPPFGSTKNLKPGQLLKVQAFTDPTAYAIPPSTALSRFLYTTTTLNGTLIPASAFILWPYTPHQFPSSSGPRKRNPSGSAKGKVPAVLWTHGTSGFSSFWAPSAHRALWYEHAAPFALAEAGYAVVAPDYAGLGVATSWDGSHIPHQYSAAPAAAHDALYSMRAALAAFPANLGSDFVVLGHSQGGATAWAVAETLAREKVAFADLLSGYRGTVAASPPTDVFRAPAFFILPTVGQALHSIFPAFRLSDWLTPLGEARARLALQVEGGITAVQQLYFGRNDTYWPGWDTASWYAAAFARLSAVGRRDFAGPLLVVQGTADLYIPFDATNKTVADTQKLLPKSDLEFLVAAGVGHVPVLHATRQFWLRWIEARLAGEPLAQKGPFRTDLQSVMPIKQHLLVGNSFPLWGGLPEYQYELPLGL
ncbi:Alpha/Beta hydrolase protein [Lasiosphaeria miniovina]|uniref:Alpha/Beta hydrolase protein n=1 Tax=Lasiosphaeria miniovina TaxID=1954250 RepID=A0AA40DT61_9PEZI|nr:Alpha/Beta hydrolase protein [Lasiosphaeria miniovina]KAK0712402.1 Alpha/Beta hydrolase protein [Lasiosphaeria miniovina]